MSEASLAVQGITKLQLELEQKDRELKISNDQSKLNFELSDVTHIFCIRLNTVDSR